MKAIISSTYDDNYLFSLPITTWCWNKLGVDVICFMPDRLNLPYLKYKLVIETVEKLKFKKYKFDCPSYKEATYAQCSRLYAAALDLPEDEILIISDVDMGLFKLPPIDANLTIFGRDLVPFNQYPMCYASGAVKVWRKLFKIELNIKTYQQCLDELLGDIEADHFRGNYWGKDQETLYKQTVGEAVCIDRARPGTQFASNRYDRDDAYLLERLSPDAIDFHMPRPGYEENNFDIILKVLKYHYPNENFQWLIEYQKQYLKLVNS